ncbi:MAG: hypothetical protein V3T84_10675 [Phycisphaerales bacterium]
MSITSIDYVFDFDDANYDLSGTISVLNPRTKDPQQAFLVFAKFTDRKSHQTLEIQSNSGIWYLSVPTEKGNITFSPQLNCLTVIDDSCDELHKISFDNKGAILDLDKSLQKDNHFFPIQIRFLEAVTPVLVDIESKCYIEFELLDDILGLAQISDGDRRRRRRKRRLFPPRDFQVDWELLGFIDCMKECEEDCSWWEIWWHAWCLVKCLVKCARPSIPDSATG